MPLPPAHQYPCDMSPSSTEEVRNAIKSFKKYKFPGEDILLAENYKASPALVLALTDQLCKFWSVDYVAYDYITVAYSRIFLDYITVFDSIPRPSLVQTTNGF